MSSQQVLTRRSSMRKTTAPHDDVTKRNPNESYDVIKQRILARRVVFKWLPCYCQNDLVHGSWWYVWGSALTVLIPIFPLISIYEGFWPIALAQFFPDPPHVAAYLLIAIAGIFYTVGSWIFINAFREPIPDPMINDQNCPCFATDELFAVWMFMIGTLPFIPLMAMYVYYDPIPDFKLALFVVVLANVLFFIFSIAVSPLTKAQAAETVQRSKEHDDGDGGLQDRVSPYILPCLKFCCCCSAKSLSHIKNDWLLAMWLTYYGCIFSTIFCFIMFVDHAFMHNRRGIYDYVTGTVDMIFFLVGTMYILAGSYEPEQAHSDTHGLSEMMQRKGAGAADEDVNV